MLLAALIRQIHQGLQPEISDVEDLQALLHKANRQQGTAEFRDGAQLRGDAREQHGLPPAPPAHDERVLAGWGTDVLAEYLQDGLQLPRPNHELVDDLLVRLEDTRVELPDDALRRRAHEASFSLKPMVRSSNKGL